MLVLLGPSFEDNRESCERLAQLTGLVAYDLRAKIKPGYWNVVRALADARQARQLCARLQDAGFPAVLIDSSRAWDPDRRFVSLMGLRFDGGGIVLQLWGREMTVANGVFLVGVRGEVGSAPHGRIPRPSSSVTYRAVVPTSSEPPALREPPGRALDSYQALDLHFLTVKWVARVDPRTFDFSCALGPGEGQSSVQALERLSEELASRCGVRIDRGARLSSLASFVTGQRQRGLTPAPSSREPGSRRSNAQSPSAQTVSASWPGAQAPGAQSPGAQSPSGQSPSTEPVRDRADVYSLLVADAELAWRSLVRRSSRPPLTPRP